MKFKYYGSTVILMNNFGQMAGSLPAGRQVRCREPASRQTGRKKIFPKSVNVMFLIPALGFSPFLLLSPVLRPAYRQAGSG